MSKCKAETDFIWLYLYNLNQFPIQIFYLIYLLLIVFFLKALFYHILFLQKAMILAFQAHTSYSNLFDFFPDHILETTYLLPKQPNVPLSKIENKFTCWMFFNSNFVNFQSVCRVDPGEDTKRNGLVSSSLYHVSMICLKCIS